ncbi:MAG: chromosome segregation protein SMC, partial [Saprospiraceae bacterium]
MRLTTLEIKGFKSFAERTVINFNEDVIGIVGPNGCGKSNIVDAMRWVLGEQKSKELRSEKMSSVIFNGSKKKRQSGVAEVSLTFENTKNILPTEFGAVTITRILFRSGESEYRINGVQCRLKDITNLFLDTGIGSNSYAIIALNMVDDLLTDRENSRRKLFEQAAGISKYKKRKRETLNKLKGTSADLERVEDLLFEIEGNLKRLEKEAKRAKRYLEIKEQYQNYAIELAVHQLNAYKTRYKVLANSLQTEQAKYLQLQGEIHTREAGLEKSKQANLDKEKKLAEEQKKLNSIVGNIRGRENDKQLAKQKIEYVQQRKQTLKDNIKQQQEEILATEDELDYYRGEINIEKDVEDTLETQLMNAQMDLDEIRGKHQSLKTELDDYIRDQRIIDRDIFNLEKEQAINTTKTDNLTREIQRSEVEIQKRQAELGTLQQQILDNQGLQDAQKELVEKAEKAEIELQKSIENTQNLIETLKDERNKVNRKLDSSRNEYNLTKSLVESLEGFPESIKFLSKNKNWQSNATLLSDLIYCKEEYRAAIETYLEPYLNYYIVKNKQEALEAIALLENAKKGKANFFLLDAFENKAFEKAIPTTETVSAFDVVTVDAEYNQLVQHLLSNVLIGENAVSNSVENDSKTVYLSQTGAFIQRRFSLSGGSVGTFEGKRIGRKKNLELLEQTIGKLKIEKQNNHEQLQQLEQQLRQLRNSTQKNVIIREQKHLDSLTRQSISLKTRLENFQTFLNEAHDNQAQKQKIILEIHQKNDILSEQLTAKKMEAQSLKNNISSKDSTYRTIADELTKASEDYNQKNIQFIRQQNKITALQKEINFRKKRLSDLIAKLEIDSRNFAAADGELDEATQKVVDLDQLLATLYQSKSDQQVYLNDVEQVYYASRGSITVNETEVRQLNRKSQDLQQVIQELKDKFNALKLELSSISERLKIEFNLEADTLFNRKPTEEFTQEELTQKTAKLKNRLFNYGEINAMAIEAYDEMKERYDFITDQKKDLESARESLLSTIKEIENIATVRFMEAFEQVRTHFKTVFQSLFMKDDDCDLLLETPEDPL